MIVAMRSLVLVAACLACAAAAEAGDALSSAQQIQALQSALAILGYDPGPADGVMGPQTRDAIAAYGAATGFAADGDDPQQALLNALLDDVRPALASAFGIDPTGAWDVDAVASGLPPEDAAAPCQSPYRGTFSDGIIWRNAETGVPLVYELDGERLAMLPNPSGEFFEPHAYTVVDADTLHLRVEGNTEVWVRCD